jgi:hypothetical protein
MTLVLATLPDDAAHLPVWLEEHLVGGTLRALVSELVAVHRPTPPTDSVRDRLGPLLSGVLERGLAALPPELITLLLQQPYYLIELQGIVLQEGGPYWDTVHRTDEFQAAVRTGRARVEAELSGPASEPGPVGTVQPAVRPGRGFGRLRTVGLVAAVAVVVFVATFTLTRWLGPRSPVGGTSWGWAKTGAFPEGLDRAAYLNRLADEADEWFAQRPQDPPSAAKRLTEFRAGCSALLLAEHPALPPADRVWLAERCRNWRKAFDEHLARLEDTGDVAAALSAADATVHQLSAALRARATLM